MWTYRGQRRPDFALPPGPGQESVWDYPRPPALVPDQRLVEVSHQGTLIARTTAAWRVLETASPPTFYLPRADVDLSQLVAMPGRSFCEWKGLAGYWGLQVENGQRVVAWSYEVPSEDFLAIRGMLGFYPGLLACTVDGQPVRPQPGEFYAGWVTDEVIGPFKGEPGTGHW